MTFTTKSGRHALFCGALLAFMHTVPAQASDTANVTVTATIVNRTCTTDWANDPGKTNISLGTIDAATMTEKAGKGGEKEFTLTLTNCSNVNTVKVTAKGTSNPEDSTDFKNNGTAQHVGVYIKGGADENTTLHPDGTGVGTYTVSNGTVAMKFKAILERTSQDSAPTSGSVTVPVTLNMNYD